MRKIDGFKARVERALSLGLEQDSLPGGASAILNVVQEAAGAEAFRLDYDHLPPEIIGHGPVLGPLHASGVQSEGGGPIVRNSPEIEPLLVARAGFSGKLVAPGRIGACPGLANGNKNDGNPKHAVHGANIR
jgi:2-keto-3-deoxy-6-phosphogluconate aldolase